MSTSIRVMSYGVGYMKLLEINDGENACIDAIPEGEAGTRLEALGLRAGKVVTKVSSMPFGGPVTLLLDGRHFAISHTIAGQITVISTADCPERTAKRGN